jgi:hypothetical protein
MKINFEITHCSNEGTRSRGQHFHSPQNRYCGRFEKRENITKYHQLYRDFLTVYSTHVLKALPYSLYEGEVGSGEKGHMLKNLSPYKDFVRLENSLKQEADDLI